MLAGYRAPQATSPPVLRHPRLPLVGLGVRGVLGALGVLVVLGNYCTNITFPPLRGTR